MTGWKMWEHGVPDSRLEVIERYPENDNANKPLWKCKCRCGKETIVKGAYLKNGVTKSCGCYAAEVHQKQGQANSTNIAGKRFSKLVALEPTDKRNDNHVIWKCKCDCGNIVYASTKQLKSMSSCGCSQRSIGEQNILNFLQSGNYNFIYNKAYFPDLIMSKGGKGRYDFIILDEQNNPIRLIEFDGKQHLSEQYNLWFSQMTSFEERYANDQIKNQYAISHNIPLVRIPYNYKNNITKEILFGDVFLIPEFKN